jgi:hypothetical protein
MSELARERLGRLQAELVRALVAQGPTPPGFDEKRLRAAAHSLVSKRREALERAWPSLTESLRDSFVEKFTNYAEAEPLPACAVPLADGRAFLRWLDARAPLSDAARVEGLSFDVRFVVTATGLRPRRGFALRWVRLLEKPGLVIAVRVPWLGERWWHRPR